MTEVCDKCGQVIPGPIQGLTTRELDALSAYWHMGSVKAAADLCGVAEQTLKNHLYRARIRNQAGKSLQLAQMYLGKLRSKADLIALHNRGKHEAA